jgi:hypothetical protein
MTCFPSFEVSAFHTIASARAYQQALAVSMIACAIERLVIKPVSYIDW